jgi:hypothetical protein
MASVRADRRQGVLPGPGQGGKKSLSVLVTMLAAVLAAIALIWSVSGRAPPGSSIPRASAEPAPAVPAPQPAAEPEPALAATPALGQDEDAGTTPSQRKIARVIDGGRDGIKACYQRALVRNDTLVHGRMNVRLSIAPSGRVDNVKVTGPEAFHSVQACLQRTTARWSFPVADEPYAAEFPLVFQGAL